MALTLIPTFTPSGYAYFVTAYATASGTGISGIVFNNPRSTATAIALPTGTTPATVLITLIDGAAAILNIAAAAATTTGTQATVGANTIVVASATGILVGQVVVDSTAIAPGTTVTAISGTTITISNPTLAVLSAATLNFVTAVTPSTGIAVTPFTPLALNYVSSGFLCAICVDPGNKSVMNVAVGV